MSVLRLALPATSLGSAMTPSSSLLSRYIMHIKLPASLHGRHMNEPACLLAVACLCYLSALSCKQCWALCLAPIVFVVDESMSWAGLQLA